MFQNQRGWRSYGMPILSDFGEMRIGESHEGLIQPDLYRAPEVVLGGKWTSKVDIWNVGVLVRSFAVYCITVLSGGYLHG